jgi:thymidine phosphorylase
MTEIEEQMVDTGLGEGQQNALERKYIAEYLQGKGYRREDLVQLPREIARQLMREACQYATLKLAEVEAKGHLRKKIHF